MDWCVGVLLTCLGVSQASQFVVNTSSIIHTIDAEYVSANLDFSLIAAPVDEQRWRGFDVRNPRVTTLLRGLAPCYLRFGGSNADHTIFSTARASITEGLGPLPLYTIYPWDVEDLIRWTRQCGARLLYDLNVNLRYTTSWDPTNTLILFQYLMDKGYGQNIDFELGNEPDAGEHLSGKQLGEDFTILLKLLNNFPNLARSSVVGADIVTMGGLSSLMPDFLKAVGGNLTATTFHQYYFEGLGAKVADYINPKHFDSLRNNIGLVKDLVKAHSPNKQLPMWIGETADAWHSGTENITDRYVSGFLWLDKLGLAAQLGVSALMRQTFYGGYYPLVSDRLLPNPDYWLSYVHKKLVGRKVFSARARDHRADGALYWRSGIQLVRMYAHCTKASARYQPGALTVFGLNLQKEAEVITFDPWLAQLEVDAYVLTPYGPGGLLSQSVSLNGKLLRMVSDYQLPDLEPVSGPAARGIKVASLTFGFWVFPNASIKACM